MVKNLFLLFFLIPSLIFAQQKISSDFYLFKNKRNIFQLPNTNRIIFLRNDSVYFENCNMPMEGFSSGKYIKKGNTIKLNSYFDKYWEMELDVNKLDIPDSNFVLKINLDYSYDKYYTYSNYSEFYFKILIIKGNDTISFIINNDTTVNLSLKPDGILLCKYSILINLYNGDKYEFNRIITNYYTVSEENGIEIHFHNMLPNCNYIVYEDSNFSTSRKDEYYLQRIGSKRLIRILKRRDQIGTIKIISQWML